MSYTAGALWLSEFYQDWPKVNDLNMPELTRHYVNEGNQSLIPVLILYYVSSYKIYFLTGHQIIRKEPPPSLKVL